MNYIAGLKKTYPNKKPIELSRFDLLSGQVNMLWGPSGVGKSTVFRILLGLETADASYSLVLQGVEYATIDIRHKGFGVVFQNYDLFSHLTAKENILFAAKARGLCSAESKTRLADLAEQLSIGSILESSASVLSGGEKQRVALARALVARPHFLLLDEPFAALDEALRADARSLVKQTLDSYQITTLMISHFKEDREIFGRSVHIM